MQHIDSRSVIPLMKAFSQVKFLWVGGNAHCCKKHTFMFLMDFHYKVVSTLTILLGDMLFDT